MTEETPVPVKARLVRFKSATPAEAVLIVEKEGGRPHLGRRPAHGPPVLGDAQERYRPTIMAL